MRFNNDPIEPRKGIRIIYALGVTLLVLGVLGAVATSCHWL